VESGFRTVHAAFVAGDERALRLALGDPSGFPNMRLPMDYGMGDWPLCYAIAWSPIALIERLLDIGACVRPQVSDGFPPVISALYARRPDQLAALDVLLRHGADPNERGVGDMTPLHVAIARCNLPAIRLLLRHGANPDLATRIDNFTTPLDDASAMGWAEAVRVLQGNQPTRSAVLRRSREHGRADADHLPLPRCRKEQ